MSGLPLFAVYLLAVAAIGGAAYFKGRADGAAPLRTQLAVLAAQAQEQKDHHDEVVRKLGTALSHLHQENSERAAQVVQVVRAPVYRRACFDDAGLRLANSALANATGRAAGALSAPGAAR